MCFRYQDNFNNINWSEIPALLEKVGMAHTDIDTHRISFENSHSSIFIFDNDELIGFGRMISDGVRQSAIYDVAIDPNYQGKGLGASIIEQLMTKTPDCNFILYASPGKEGFYKKLGFRRMKTGMALFKNKERMIDGGFIEE